MLLHFSAAHLTPFCLLPAAACLPPEEVLGINKAAISLLMAVSLWTIRSTGGDMEVRGLVQGARGPDRARGRQGGRG